LAAFLLLAAAAGAQAAGKIHVPSTVIGGPTTDGRCALMGKAENTKCDSLAKLDKDTAALDKDTLALAGRFSDISTALGVTAKALAAPGDLSKALDAIKTALETVQAGAKAAEGVPELREKAKDLQESVGASLTEVKTLKAKADRIAAKVEPARKAAKSGSDGFGDASKVLKSFASGVLVNEPKATAIIQYSLYYLNDPQLSCLRGKVDSGAGDLDKMVLEMDRVEKIMLYSPEIPELKPFKKFAALLDPVAKLQADVDALARRLDPLQSSLQDIERLMDKDFSIKISKKFRIKISGEIILKGSKAIQDEIEKLVGTEIYDVAKAFGLDKIIHSLVSDARKDLDRVLKKLDLGVNVHLPDLGVLDSLEAAIDAELPGLPAGIAVPKIDMSLPGFGLPGMDPSIDLTQFFPGLKNFTAPYSFDWGADWAKLEAHPPTLGCPK
jgi:hypothetical protein